MGIEHIPVNFPESEKESVAVEVEDAVRDRPEQITRLGEKKLEFLTKIAGIKPTDIVLELFGGSNLSTAVFASKNPERLVTVDLHYAPSKRVEWSFKPSLNLETAKKELASRRITKPVFVNADAVALPFKDQTFSLVLAPDSPRNALERFEGEEKHYTAGKESDLSLEEQKELFLTASKEAHRVLLNGGRYVGSAPVSWARQLKNRGFEEVILIGSREIGDDIEEPSEFTQNRKFQFKIRGVKDPVVYFKCLK